MEGASELLVDIFGVIHELAAREVFAVLEYFVQLQVMILVFVCDCNHLPGLVQRVMLVHRVHVFLQATGQDRVMVLGCHTADKFPQKCNKFNKSVDRIKKGPIREVSSPRAPPW